VTLFLGIAISIQPQKVFCSISLRIIYKRAPAQHDNEDDALRTFPIAQIIVIEVGIPFQSNRILAFPILQFLGAEDVFDADGNVAATPLL